MKTFASMVCWMVLSVHVVSLQAEPPRGDQSGIQSAMDAEIASHHAAGVVTLVMKDGNVIHHSAAGHSSLEKKRPMTTDAVFWIASMTKSISASVVMTLVDEGKLSLDEPAAKWLPELGKVKLANGQPPSRPVTLRDLMSHTSGLAFPPRKATDGAHSLKSYTMELLKAPLAFEPGSAYEYGFGLTVAGHIAEVVTGQAFDRLVSERILIPLAMKSTSFHPDDQMRAKIASTYKSDDAGTGLIRANNPFVTSDAEEKRMTEPSGGLFSTAGDMAKFYQMILDGGVCNGKRILSTAAIAEMTKPHPATGKVYYGLGWQCSNLDKPSMPGFSKSSFGHGGAYATHGWIDPERNLVAVFMVQNVLVQGSAEIRNAFHAKANALVNKNASAFGENVQHRGNLNNSFLKFSQTKKGTVAFMGGSITEMNGYRPMVCDILKKKFPETEFTFIDAGISSTCSTTGAARLERDVLNHGPVDLLFLEFAVNDDQDAHHSREACIRGLEGIVRHARTSQPNIDLVVTYFVNEGMLQTIQSGQTPLTIDAHEQVTKHYDVPSIHLAREVAEEISAGVLTWKDYGGVHPAPRGNGIAAGMIDDLFSRALKSEGARRDDNIKPHRLPEPIDALSYSRGRFVDPAQAMIKSGFKLEVPDWDSISGSKRPRFTSIPMLSASEAGGEFSLAFEGTAIGLFVVAGPDAGITEASIDNGPFVPIDLYHAYSKQLHYPRTVMLSDQLKPGKHNLILRISDKTSSGKHAVRIMQFVVN